MVMMRNFAQINMTEQRVEMHDQSVLTRKSV